MAQHNCFITNMEDFRIFLSFNGNKVMSIAPGETFVFKYTSDEYKEMIRNCREQYFVDINFDDVEFEMSQKTKDVDWVKVGF